MHFEETLSVLPGMRCWAANCGRYHFVITHEDGASLRGSAKFAWTGYTASYKSLGNSYSPAVRIDGLWQSFKAAEKARADCWRQLRQAH